jgi:hypothetical protein
MLDLQHRSGDNTGDNILPGRLSAILAVHETVSPY